MKAAELVKKYLQQKQVMQLATVKDGQPWVCNLHFVADENNVLYWISKDHRRHSQEVNLDSKAAVAIAIKEPEHPVIGIQIEGDAMSVTDKQEIKAALELFSSRQKLSKEFYDGMLSGTAPESLYKFVPRITVLFDEENFPNDPRQEVKA
jgi:uncharacterized protein YhbP (UPF0306 family)